MKKFNNFINDDIDKRYEWSTYNSTQATIVLEETFVEYFDIKDTKSSKVKIGHDMMACWKLHLKIRDITLVKLTDIIDDLKSKVEYLDDVFKPKIRSSVSFEHDYLILNIWATVR
jgi:hypothetical protein